MHYFFLTFSLKSDRWQTKFLNIVPSGEYDKHQFLQKFKLFFFIGKDSKKITSTVESECVHYQYGEGGLL